MYIIPANNNNIYSDTDNYLYNQRQACRQKGIKIQMLIWQSLSKEKLSCEKDYLDIIEYKILPDYLAPPYYTVIYGNKILFEITGQEMIALLIENKEIAEKYRKYFSTLWNFKP